MLRLFRRKESAGVVVLLKDRIVERPSITFESYINAYLGDPYIAAAVDLLTDQVLGSGFYTYSEDERAKEVIDEFNRRVGMDNLLKCVVKEVVLAGNSFLELVEPTSIEELRPIRLSSVVEVVRDRESLKPLYYKLREGGRERELESGRVVHFRFNPVNNSAFGIGMIHQLLEGRSYQGKYVPPLIEIKAQMEDDMRKVLHHYLPRHIYQFKGTSDEVLKNEIAPLIRELEAGEDLLTNKEVEIKEVKLDPRARFGEYISYVENQILAGLQTPVIKLFTTPGFTEASAKAAIAISERKVRSVQRFVKRVVENEIWDRVLKQSGIPSKVRMNWGQPDVPKLEFRDVMRAFELGVISKEEARRMLADMGWRLD